MKLKSRLNSKVAFLALRALQSVFSATEFKRNGILNTVRANYVEKIHYVMLKQKASSHLITGEDFC
jgi:hypothetical protein